MGLSKTTLTELNAAKSAVIDLASGYPKIRTEPWIGNYVEDYYSFGVGISSFDTDSFDAERRALQGLLSLFGLPHELWTTATLFPNASIALQRSISSSVRPGFSVAIVCPVLDVIPAIVSELSSGSTFFFSTLAELAEYLQSPSSHCSLVVLVQPGNPHSIEFDLDEFSSVLHVCAEKGVRVLNDRCFGKMGTADQQYLSISALAPANLKWYEVLDTGKMFDFGHEKLAAVICDSGSYSLLHGFSTLVLYSMPVRSLQFWAHFLNGDLAGSYLERLRALCDQNRALLAPVLGDLGFSVMHGDVLPFMTVGPRAGSLQDPPLVDLFMSFGIGVVEVSSFYPVSGPIDYSDWVRLCLSRDSSVIREAVKCLNVVRRSRGGEIR